MDSKQIALADYIVCLSKCSEKTHHASDRPIYQLFLADASVLLALLVKGTDSMEFENRIRQHERLSGHTFLVDPEHNAVTESWQKFESTT